MKGINIIGVQGLVVDVTAERTDSLPGFDIVGLHANAAAEARHRVRAAVRSSGYAWPSQRVTVKIAPADPPPRATHTSRRRWR